MARRGLGFSFIILCSVLSGLWLRISPVYAASKYCEEGDTSRFTLDGTTITHSCGEKTSVRYRKVDTATNRELASVTTVAGRGSDVSDIFQAHTLERIFKLTKPPEYSYEVFRLENLSLAPNVNFYLVADVPQFNILFGLWTDQAGANFEPRYSSGLPAGVKYFDLPFFAVPNILLGGESNESKALINQQRDPDIRTYLHYVNGRNDWGLFSKEAGAGLGARGCAHKYDDYVNSNKLNYFAPPRFFGEAGVNRVARQEFRIAITGKKATITLPANSPRPEITFRYQYWMPWNGWSVADANYFYFLPDPPDNHCNLALRISDGAEEETGRVVVINLDKITKESNPNLFELGEIGFFDLVDNGKKEFLNTLYQDKNGDGKLESHEKRTLEPGSVDELGGIRVGSGQNPGAAGTPGGDCPIKIELIGPALCTVADLIMGVAVSLANLSFRLLLQATTLQ